MAKFGSARIDENGRARGGRAGDNNSREVMVQEAYMHKNGWTIIRAKDPNIANALAFIMAIACASDEVGYNQDERYAIFWTNIQKGVPTNCDCSTLVPWCVRQAGITNFEVDGFYTGNEVERLAGTGQFDILPCHSINDMYTGDILVDAAGTSHTGIIVEGKPRTSGNYFDEPDPILRRGYKGGEVRKLQEFFNRFASTNLDVDGDFGPNTEFALLCFQKFFNLQQDGIYGPKSHEAVCFVLWCNNVQAV